MSDGYGETLSHPEVEPEDKAENFVESELEELDLDNVIGEADLPLAVVDEAEIPDVDLAAPEIEGEEEEFFPDEEEEDNEDVGWAGRGRKKPRPGRQMKTPKKSAKRDTRRGF